jgi:Bacterial PH domain
VTIDTDSVVSYKSPWSYFWSVAVAVIWFAASVVLYFGFENTIVRGVIVVVSAAALVLVVRSFLSSVTINRDGLIVHEILRTRTYKWSDVDAIDVGSQRLSGSGGKAYRIRCKSNGEALSIKPTLHGWTPKGRLAIGHLLSVAERASEGQAVVVSRSDPWNAGTSFPV